MPTPTRLVAVAAVETHSDTAESAEPVSTCVQDAVACVVDTAALEMHCYLLSEPPCADQQLSCGNSSSNGACQSPGIVSQVANLLQQLRWWRESTEAANDDQSRTGVPGDVHVSWLAQFETQARALQSLQGVGHMQLIDGSEPLTVEMREEIELHIGRLLKRPNVLRAWKAEFPHRHEELLRGFHHVMTQWGLYEETKYECAFELQFHTEEITPHMRLNPAAKAAFTSPSPRQSSSIFKMLSPLCCTKAGRKRLAQTIERPSVDSHIVRQRHSLVTALTSVSSLPTPNGWMERYLSGIFSHFRSLETQLEKFVRPGRRSRGAKLLLSELSFQDFELLGVWLRQLSVLLEARSERQLGTEDEKLLCMEFVSPLQELWAAHLSSFCTAVSDTICTSISSSSDKPEASEHVQRGAQLWEIQAWIRQCESDIDRAKNHIASVLRLPPERIKIEFEDDTRASLRGMRVLLRVSRQDGHRVHQHSGSLLTVQRTSKASGVLFSSNSLDQLSAVWQTLRKRHREAEDDLVQQLFDMLHSNTGDALAQMVEIVAELDVLQSFSTLSSKKGFVRPRLVKLDVDKWTLRLVNPFDPFQDDEQQRSGHKLEVKLSQNNSKTFLLLTSNNNTCALETIGLIATLNQIGCFVPCDEAELPIFDAIFLRTGAYDEQFFGHSTFMTEMVEVSKIFRFMTEKSLVLVDDICRGTSNAEGLALALSLCQHLMERGTLTCFMSEWRELIDQLLLEPATSVPQRLINSLSGDNRILTSGKDEDREFVDLLATCDFPEELLQSIQADLHDPGLQNTTR